MLLSLVPHPDAPPGPTSEIDVSVERTEALLELHFRVRGNISDLSLPDSGEPGERRDELWKHTCFEAFLAAGEGGYIEFNFAPSGEWAAYVFTGYRAGMVNALVPKPLIYDDVGDNLYHLWVEVELAELATARPLRLGLSAIIEDTSGAKTYWALKHAPGKPDFHHPDAFASEIP